MRCQKINYVLNNNNYPDGLVGDIAHYFYDSSPYMCHEAALLSAISFFSGIAGRQYVVNGSGCNLYTAFLSDDDVMCDIANKAVVRLYEDVTKRVYAASDFINTDVSSLSQLAAYLSVSPCFVYIIKEPRFIRSLISAGFGRETCNLPSLLDNSGPLKSLMSLSQKRRIDSPAPTLYAITDAEMFYHKINADTVVNRIEKDFLVLEDTQTSRMHVCDSPISPIDSLIPVISYTLQKRSLDMTTPVAIDHLAKSMIEKFAAQQRDANKNVNRCLTSSLCESTVRNIYRLAALIAVGINYIEPKITIDIAHYAIYINSFSRFQLTLRMHDSAAIRRFYHAKNVIHSTYSTEFGIDRNAFFIALRQSKLFSIRGRVNHYIDHLIDAGYVYKNAEGLLAPAARYL